MGSRQKVAKGLPKRCSNAKLKTRRQASWQRGQERKQQRRDDQAQRHQRNRAQGQSPWQVIKLAHRTSPAMQEKPLIIDSGTSYHQIRRATDKFLGTHPEITPSYLDRIHVKWRKLGAQAARGVL